jgi:hypothetical protein
MKNQRFFYGAKNGLRLSASSSAILYDWRMNKLYLESLLISFQVLKLPVTVYFPRENNKG